MPHNKIIACILFFIFYALLATEAARDSIVSGDQAYLNRNYEESIRYYTKAIEENPKAVLPHVRLGQIYYAKTQYFKAEEEFHKAQQLTPSGKAERFVKAALNKINKNRDLLTEIEKTPDTESNQEKLVLLHIQAADLLIKGDAYMSLIGPHLEYVLKVDPDNTDIMRYLAEGYHLSSDAVSAAGFFEKLAQINPGDYIVHFRLANAYERLLEYKKAKLEYKKALLIAQKKYDKSELEDNREKWEAEITKCDARIIELDIRRENIGELLQEKKYKDAESALLKYIALNPNDAYALTILGQVYERLDRPGEAEQMYARAIINDPDLPSTHFYMGQYYFLVEKNYKAALNELEIYRRRIIKVFDSIEDPAEIEFHRENLLFATQFIAQIYLEVIGDTDRAIFEYRLALKGDPTNAAIRYNLGITYLHAQRIEEAYSEFQILLSIEDNPDIIRKSQEAMAVISDYYLEPDSA